MRTHTHRAEYLYNHLVVKDRTAGVGVNALTYEQVFTGRDAFKLVYAKYGRKDEATTIEILCKLMAMGVFDSVNEVGSNHSGILVR
jgi:hypothetical protein